MKKIFSRHYEESLRVKTAADKLFAFVDDHSNFSSHMNQSSWMMGGGRMSTEIDAGKGKEVGSHIRMGGKAFGVSLFLDEVITERIPPTRKVWETVGTPKLIVIGPYRLGFSISPDDEPNLNVFIDYDLPTSVFPKILGYLFGGIYARWCVHQMISGAAKHFN